MNRVELLREFIDERISRISDSYLKRCAYLHLYGVAQACALLAMKRGEDIELAVIAGMLHDFYSYESADTADHAHKGAIRAREILLELQLTDEAETELVCSAIDTHSEKDKSHSSFSELLIDADVLQHCLYHPMLPFISKEIDRFEKLKHEFGLNY